MRKTFSSQENIKIMRQKGIKKWTALIVLGVLLVLSGLVSAATENIISSKTIYVPDDYSTIQAAVDAASAGDTIIVKSGTYYENVKVDKQLNLIGEGNPVVDAGGSGSVITLSANGIRVEGFTVKNSGGFLDAGINVTSNNNIVTGNTITNNDVDGIYLPESSSNNTITGNNISNNVGGITLEQSSSNNTITGNTISNNEYWGILAEFCGNNTITGNNISGTKEWGGIILHESNNNQIYLNNFVNKVNVYSAESTNIWNSPQPIAYTYKGSEYVNYLGNYWSDYKGSDAGGDGIGDTPYTINGDKDNYPLMQQFEDYIQRIVFDTGPGTYPSIFGTHTGTITPSHDVYVSKMYTYPSSGTGGHSEYVRIYGNGIDVNGTWKGYRSGDWMNIYFKESFILKSGKTYNYEIRTGSYPQIIHKQSHETVDGIITCSNFTDVNGKVYKDWIPAIKLW